MTRQLDAALGLSRRDRELLQVTAQLRLVTGGQLQRLVFHAPQSTSNDRIARRALARLTQLGLVQRLTRRVGGLPAGSSSYVYSLTPRGAVAIGWLTGRGRLREPSLTFVQHQLAVAEVYVQLHEAGQRGQLDDIRLQTEPRCWRPLADGSGGVLKPDLFAVLSRGPSETLSFLEIDNGTEHGPALRRKAGYYAAYFASGYEQAREGVFPLVSWLVPDALRANYVTRHLGASAMPQLHRVFVDVSDFLTTLLQDDIPP